MKATNEDELFEVYQEEIKEDFKIDKSKIKRKNFDLPNSNVQISLKIEYELLDKLKKESEEKGIGYQTLLKNIVREYFKFSETNKIKEELENIKGRIILLENHISKKDINKVL
ncbi:MAG: CopG family antitoxin [Cyanobacteriota bacterium]